MDRGQRIADLQRRELFRAAVIEITNADQNRTNAPLRKSCEGRYEIAIGSGIRNNELQAQRARRRLQVCEDGLGSYRDRVCEKAEPASDRYGRRLPSGPGETERWRSCSHLQRIGG